MERRGVITNIGFIVNKTTLCAVLGPRLDEYLAGLTVKAVSKVGRPKPFRLYREIRLSGVEYYVLPRGCSQTFSRLRILDVRCELPAVAQIALRFEGELYANQVVVRDHLLAGPFAREYGQCTLNMGAGLGKTATAAGLILAMRLPTVYVVKDRFLQKQAYNDLRSFFPHASICRFDNKKYDGKKHDIVIIVINSALLQNNRFYGQFGLAIVDEIHAYCKEKRAKLFWMTQCRYLLGMSATTNDRTDRLDKVYHQHYGDVVEASTLPGFDNAGAEFQGRVKAILYDGSEEYCHDVYNDTTGMLFVPGMLDLIMRDPARNRLIVAETVKLWRKPYRYTYVFSERREHLETLAAMIREAIGEMPVIEDGVAVNTMMGGIKEPDLEVAVRSRVILTTYSFGSTGISIRHMNSAVFATPRRNGYLQTCARIMRRGSDLTIVRKFVDVVDRKCALRYQHGGRRQAYEHYGFTVKYKNVAHAAIP